MSLLGKLLGLMKKRALSPSEMQTLAHELNRPIIDNLNIIERPPCFTSKRTFSRSDIADRAQRIDWFKACGQQLDGTSSIALDPVGSWERAVLAATDCEWDATTNGASVGLRTWLQSTGKLSGADFRKLSSKFDVDVIKPFVLPAMTTALERKACEQSEPIIRGLRRILWGAYVENAVIDADHRSFFFLELFEFLEAGHCPCGWSGRWPDGKLIIF